MPGAVLKERVQLLKTVAHPTSLLIPAELAQGVKGITEIETILEIPQANISQHHTILRHNKLADFYEAGHLRCYYLLMPDVVGDLFAFLGQDYPVIKCSKEELRQVGYKRGSLPGLKAHLFEGFYRRLSSWL
jgi:ArsR family transcriptional regulator